MSLRSRLVFFTLWLVLLIELTQAQSDTVETSSGLKYYKIKSTSGTPAKPGSKVKVAYIGRFTNGEVFQSTEKDEYFIFKIGDPQIIKGWNEGFQLLRQGEKAVFIIPPWLAYGAKGAPDPTGEKQYIVPPNTTIIFEVELLEIK
ncbi:MAG: FKBP-type peptidyl-prolyl cis-trans isomerase [Cytophagaceae bacterium]|nr:FKBP-type peptidyl-prolyl cis-trans isomerase [Cytophagaceae bacterium]MDW8457362.1 FKBP-type peptidyl-prolyl cis-trans isomerase [Cytophagaceae bacterium]